jgi:hypothetical protein
MQSVAKRANVRTGSFWGELQPREHSVQIYRDETMFLDALEGYVSAGLRGGESVILIATAAHLHELEKRLRANWLDLDRARWEDRYIALLAQETLSRFMVDGMPDAGRFEEVAKVILAQARGASGRRVRAFGEMVALLWAEGNCPAAIALEGLWNKLQAGEEFPLFCAYPHSGFEGDAALQSVCATHSRIIPGYA